MTRRLTLLLVCCLATAGLFAQPREQRTPSKRAQLPKFDEKLVRQIFFDDVFSNLQGRRPARLRAASTGAPVTKHAAPAASDANFSWAKLISAGTIEDEVKAIKLSVDRSVRSSGDFARRGFLEVRRDFSVLTMLFAIISDYGDDVRWKRDAAAARDRFLKTAAAAQASGNARVFAEAQQRQEDLARLLRGSGLEAPASTNSKDWARHLNRAMLMQRLETAFDRRLLGWTSSPAEFAQNVEDVLHEAEMIAAIGQVLTMEGMEDGDDEEYAAIVKRMQVAAAEIVEATRTEQAAEARRAAGQISKACAECHDLYR